jgi:hypothetical protein
MLDFVKKIKKPEDKTKRKYYINIKEEHRSQLIKALQNSRSN